MQPDKRQSWVDLEGSDDDAAGLQREWGARREEFWNSGYREGLEAGKQKTVQTGFNAGGLDSMHVAQMNPSVSRPCLAKLPLPLLLYRVRRGREGWIRLGGSQWSSGQLGSL
jgi:hypothetical protein